MQELTTRAITQYNRLEVSNMLKNHRTDKRKFAVGICLFILTACVTINIYFPAAEVNKTAEEIVRDVRGEDAANLDKKEPEANKEPGPVSLKLIDSRAWAGKELDVSNATIRNLKNRIKGNYPLLRNWLIEGVLGEGYNGLIVMKNQAGLNLKARVEAKRTMEEENTNRKALYAAVAKALDIPASQTARIAKIFAKHWQQTVPRGTWIETAPGKWVKR